MKTEAIIFPQPDRIAFGQVEVADPEPGDAVVRTVTTLVSTGSDTRVLHGRQVGAAFPLVPGYSSVGLVEQVVGDVGSVSEGDFVFAGGQKGLVGAEPWWGAQAAHCVKPADSLVPLDERRSAEEYAFTKVAGIALHGVRRTWSEPADRIAVIGQGLIGQLHARIQAAMGRLVVAADVLPWRLERSTAGGVLRAINATEEDVAAVVRDMWPDGVQVAVEASARQEGIDLCADLLIEREWDSEERLPVLLIQSSFMGRIEVEARPLFMKEYLLLNSRDTTPRDLAGAVGMIGSGALAVADLITLKSRPQEAADAFKELTANPDRHLTCVFEW